MSIGRRTLALLISIAASCTEEVIAAAEASGCIALIIGMESGNPTILRQIAKPGTVDTFLRAAEVLRRHERINSNVYFMLGFPGETIGMIRDTIEIARRMGLDWYRMKPLQPLPSTPMVEPGRMGELATRATSREEGGEIKRGEIRIAKSEYRNLKSEN